MIFERLSAVRREGALDVLTEEVDAFLAVMNFSRQQAP